MENGGYSFILETDRDREKADSRSHGGEDATSRQRPWVRRGNLTGAESC